MRPHPLPILLTPGTHGESWQRAPPSGPIGMRLDELTRDIIKREIHAALGEDSVIRLFGSRVDDAQRGGDIDLLIDSPTPNADRVQTECALSARLYMQLGGRKVDVLIRDPSTALKPVHRQALQHGIVL
jgi:predicted nucleotidyltransferase